MCSSKDAASNCNAQLPDPPGPSMLDVITTKKLLLSLRLPLEIIDLILDLAGFWPHVTCTSQYRKVVHSDGPSLWIRDWRSLPFSMDHGPVPEDCRIMPRNAFLLRTHPLGLRTHDPALPVKTGVVSRWKLKLKRDRRKKNSSGLDWLPPRGLRPCRKIIVEILSHQEATDFVYNEFGDSPTWFDVSVEKIIPNEDIGGSLVWTSSMNEEWGDELLGRSEDSPRLQVLKRVPGAGAGADRKIRYATPSNSFTDEQPAQLFQTMRTKPSLAATTRQTVIQQNYQGDAFHRQHVITWRFDDDVDMDSSEGDRLLGATGSHSNGGFVRRLECGESIVLWARARSRPRDSSNMANGTDPCINVVDRVRAHVYWAV